MAREDRELGWDDDILNEPAAPKVAAGEYDFIVDHFERAKVGGDGAYAGVNKAVVYCNICTDGDPQLKTDLILHTRMQWKLAQFFISIGLMENKEDAQLRMDWNAIGGQRGRCKVEEKPNYKDKTKTHSEITEFLPPAEGKKWGKGF